MTDQCSTRVSLAVDLTSVICDNDPIVNQCVGPPQMKITKQMTQLTMEQMIKKYQAEYGLRLFGAGAFAKVYGSPSRRSVFKFGLTDQEGNEAYLDYIKAASKYPDNPFFPRVQEVIFFHGAKKPFFVVKMERLNEVSVLSVDDTVVVDSLRGLLESSTFRSLNYILPLDRDTKKYISQVHRVFDKLGSRHNVDIHSGNVMKRGRNQYVLTDPVC
jgi:hypothetical protein